MNRMTVPPREQSRMMRSVLMVEGEGRYLNISL